MSDSEHLSGTFSNLQHLLKLSYSESPEDQQKAAMDLAKLVDGTVFPAVSFGPLAHALCRLVPSTERTVAMYSARALKILILVTYDGPQSLSTCPRLVEEIEDVMAGGQWPPAVDRAPELKRRWSRLADDASCMVEYVVDESGRISA